jgi:hypothetical protein
VDRCDGSGSGWQLELDVFPFPLLIGEFRLFEDDRLPPYDPLARGRGSTGSSLGQQSPAARPNALVLFFPVESYTGMSSEALPS